MVTVFTFAILPLWLARPWLCWVYLHFTWPFTWPIFNSCTAELPHSYWHLREKKQAELNSTAIRVYLQSFYKFERNMIKTKSGNNTVQRIIPTCYKLPSLVPWVNHPTDWCQPPYRLVSTTLPTGVNHPTDWCRPPHLLVLTTLPSGLNPPTDRCRPPYSLTVIQKFSLHSSTEFLTNYMIE